MFEPMVVPVYDQVPDSAPPAEFAYAGQQSALLLLLTACASRVYPAGWVMTCGPPWSPQYETRNSPAAVLLYAGWAWEAPAANAAAAAVPSVIAASVLPAASPDTSWMTMAPNEPLLSRAVMTGLVPASPAGVSIAKIPAPVPDVALHSHATCVIAFPAPSLTLVTVMLVLLNALK